MPALSEAEGSRFFCETWERETHHQNDPQRSLPQTPIHSQAPPRQPLLFKAVFISGFPKITLLSRQLLSSRLDHAYNVH
jgi:hypothetical protein